ncbi:MAG: DUF4431 domain-containing protein [Fusobacteriales bacterium]|nr:DUF4431 domain-containing protein [Fusobacteriales bacterium]
MKKAILSLLVLLSVIAVSDRAVYYYGINDTVILGKLVREKIKNPAGYNRNAVIYPYFIVFENPVNVVKTADTEIRNRYEIFDPVYNVLQIQLNFDSAKTEPEQLTGKTVRVTGFLLHSNSRYHYTEIILDVNKIEIVEE